MYVDFLLELNLLNVYRYFACPQYVERTQHTCSMYPVSVFF
jgi:hypothetical protein